MLAIALPTVPHGSAVADPRRTSPLALFCAVACALALAGCWRGTARTVDAAALRAEPGWQVLEGVPVIQQTGGRDCGAAAAAMLLGYWGIADDQATIRAASALPATEALSAGFLRTYLRGRGLEAFLLEATLTDLERELAAGHPVLVGVVLRGLTDGVAHYQLVIGLNRSRRRVVVLDPASGLLEDSYQGFSAEWAGSRSLALVARRK